MWGEMIMRWVVDSDCFLILNANLLGPAGAC